MATCRTTVFAVGLGHQRRRESVLQGDAVMQVIGTWRLADDANRTKAHWCPLEPEPEELQSVSLVRTHERYDYRTHRGQDRRAQASAQGERRHWNVADRKSISCDPGKLRTPSGLPVRQRICLANKGAGERVWKLTFMDAIPPKLLVVECSINSCNKPGKWAE